MVKSRPEDVSEYPLSMKKARDTTEDPRWADLVQDGGKEKGETVNETVIDNKNENEKEEKEDKKMKKKLNQCTNLDFF